jgi:hypothetical protein
MYYSGPDPEKGGTAISGKAAPAVRFLFEQGFIPPGSTVLDWGAGRAGRNAQYLRFRGCTVYAYDPFHGSSNGWEGIAKTPPKGTQFDVSLTVFVLNVVTKATQDKILKSLNVPVSYHVVRDDIEYVAKRALSGAVPNNYITDFFYEHFSDPEKDLSSFCRFGFPTGPNKFQRAVTVPKNGTRIKKLSGKYTIFQLTHERSK